jgi:DNA helicase II / ATP-dependent DNA helicase PcrA
MNVISTDKKINLTTAQAEAVYFGDGPLLVVAGAGTGKTMCLAHRVAHLVTSGRAEPGEILVLTFSNKAAAEMEERIDLLLPYAFSDIWVSTFHSFGREILSRHALDAGIFPDFRVLTPQELALFLCENLFRLPLDRYRPPSNPTFHLNALVRLLTRLKDEDISPQEYLAFATGLEVPHGDAAAEEKKAIHMEMAAFYDRAQALLQEGGFADMADLVYMPLQIFRNHALIADDYRKKFKYVLVDEFQDTNYSQYQLLNLIAAGRRNITVVGDDDQSIYKFRGAAISNILNFMDDYKDARQIVLTENFRSPRLILNASYKLITHNNPDRLEIKNNIDKRLKGREDSAAVLEHKIYDTEAAQAEGIAQLIERKHDEGYNYSDMAALFRANKIADAIIRELNVRDIPYSYQGSSGLYMRPEIRSLISFFRVVARPDDSLSLHFLAASEVYGLDADSLIHLNRYAERYNAALEDIFRDPERMKDVKGVNPDALKIIDRIILDLDRFRKLAFELTAGRLLYEFLAGTGYLGRLARRAVPNAETKTCNIAIFFDIIKSFESIAENPFALPFINHLDRLIRAGDDPPAAQEETETEAVSLLTVHKAKGLEFPLVIIAGISEGGFPSRARSDSPDVPDELVKDRVGTGDFHVQEERRLFYVGMTRAKKELYLLGARDFGGKRLRKVSRFLLEALDMPLENVRVKIAEPEAVISRFAAHVKIDRGEEAMPGSPLSLSYMHFDDYVTCPLKYKFVHVMRVPVLRHHRVAYGRAVRKAALDFLGKESEGINVEAEDVLRIFEREWTQEGFLTKEHEKIRFEEGKKALQAFHADYRGKIGKKDVVEKEYRFRLGEIQVTGKWDLLREEPEGLAIVDFRASDVRDEKSAGKKAKESIKNNFSIVAFNEIYKKPPLYLDSYFLNSSLIGRVKPKESDVLSFMEKLKTAAAGICGRDYTPDPDKFKCSNCAYMEICPATTRAL